MKPPGVMSRCEGARRVPPSPWETKALLLRSLTALPAPPAYPPRTPPCVFSACSSRDVFGSPRKMVGGQRTLSKPRGPSDTAPPLKSLASLGHSGASWPSPLSPAAPLVHCTVCGGLFKSVRGVHTAPTRPRSYRPGEERVEMSSFAHRARRPAASSPTDAQQTLVHTPHPRSPPAFLLPPQAQGCGTGSPQGESRPLRVLV